MCFENYIKKGDVFWNKISIWFCETWLLETTDSNSVVSHWQDKPGHTEQPLNISSRTQKMSLAYSKLIRNHFFVLFPVIHNLHIFCSTYGILGSVRYNSVFLLTTEKCSDVAELLVDFLESNQRKIHWIGFLTFVTLQRIIRFWFCLVKILYPIRVEFNITSWKSSINFCFVIYQPTCFGFELSAVDGSWFGSESKLRYAIEVWWIRFFLPML